MLEQGQLDDCPPWLSGSLHQTRLHAGIARYPFKVIVGKNHPLAGQEKVSFAALK